MNKTLLPLLTEKFNRLNGLYTEYLDALKVEQVMIVESKTQELGGQVRKKEAIVLQIQSVEDERVALWAELAASKGLPIGQLRLSMILSGLTPAESSGLASAKKALDEKLAQVKALNAINNQLLSDSLEYIRTAFDLVAGKQAVNVGYGRSGALEQEVRVARNLLNTRV